MERLTILLVDIQGAEIALIEQSRDLLRSGRVRFVVISTHHWTYSGYALAHQRILGDTHELGGHVIAEHTVGESFSGDGLVAASFDPRDADLTVEITRARHRDSLFGELEVDLDAAHGRHREREAEVAVQKAVLESALGEQRTANEELQSELRAMRQRRIWRYTEMPRRVYSRVRQLRGRPHDRFS